MDLEYGRVLASLPKDASSEMEKFLKIDNYIEFWKFLDETEKSFKDFEKCLSNLASRNGLNQSINSHGATWMNPRLNWTRQ